MIEVSDSETKFAIEVWIEGESGGFEPLTDVLRLCPTLPDEISGSVKRAGDFEDWDAHALISARYRSRAS